MGVLLGFAVGYFLGSQAGQDAVPRLVAAFNEIRNSDEVKELLQTGVAMGQEYLQQALGSGRSGNLADSSIVQALTSGAKDLIGRRLAA